MAGTRATTIAGLKRLGRAFENRDYRIYAVGNAVSLTGTWLQRVAVGWLAWQLARSGTWLGLIACADVLPTILLGPLAGALADRHDRVRVLRWSQAAGMGQAILLAGFAAGGRLSIGLLFALTLGLGVANAINQPARLALVPGLVREADLAAAVATNSVVFNGARFLGPVIAGFVLAQGSVALAFALNALSYLPFLFALGGLKSPPLPRPAGAAGLVGDMAAGYRYARRHGGIPALLAVLAVTSLAARPVLDLLPGFADAVFGRGAHALAWLTAVTGLGALAGGLWLVTRSDIRGMTALLSLNLLMIPAALAGFVATDRFWVALPCIGLAGFGLVVNGISVQTLVQSAVGAAMRGRVMSLYGSIFGGAAAAGALAMGWLSSLVGLRLPVAAGAAVCLLLWLWFRPRAGAIAAAIEQAPPPPPPLAVRRIP